VWACQFPRVYRLGLTAPLPALRAAAPLPEGGTFGWAEQKVIREITLFLHSNGVATSRAVRIYKTYGADAVRRIAKLRFFEQLFSGNSLPPVLPNPGLRELKPDRAGS
jgi:Helix-hairpin-helix containing domain